MYIYRTALHRSLLCQRKFLKKVRISLFVFVAVRAVYIELVHDMAAEQFLMALRKFISRRVTLKKIILDNASQAYENNHIQSIANSSSG